MKRWKKLLLVVLVLILLSQIPFAYRRYRLGRLHAAIQQLNAQRDERLDNTWFYTWVLDHPLGSKLRLLAEIYGETTEDPEGPNRLAATIGLKGRVLDRQQFHFSAGTSLRAEGEGGPRLRLYAGWRWDR